MTGFFLLIMKIKVLITTFNRPKMLLNLLQNIEQEGNNNISLLIIDDCSTEDYSIVKAYLEEKWLGCYDYYRTEKNYGKKDYWQLINFAYQKLYEDTFLYLVQLPDDVTLVDNFFSLALKAFDAIPDRKKACLNILNDYSRNGKSFWTRVKVQDHTFMGVDYLRTGWVDMCYISTKDYLRYLDFRIDPIDHTWSANENLSSGVGKQISQRLITRGGHIYQLKKSLVIHDDHPSVMHPEHRKQVKLISNHNHDKITASMATMPGREQSLEETVKSIINQVDELHIYLNDIESYPMFAHESKIKLYFSKDHHGDLGDAGKFYTADQIEGYHFTIDDDIIYPSNYVSTLIAAIEKSNRSCVVSCHGRIFGNLPVKSYYKNHTQAFSCLRNVTKNVYAHVIGTGVLAYHTDTVKVDLSLFEYSNMADIWFSKHCNSLNIPRLILAHSKGWIRVSENYDESGSIYTHQSINDSVQTKVTNSVNWSTVL